MTATIHRRAVPSASRMPFGIVTWTGHHVAERMEEDADVVSKQRVISVGVAQLSIRVDLSGTQPGPRASAAAPTRRPSWLELLRPRL